MEKELIKKIVDYHVYHVDKLYRQFGGLQSEMTDYDDETIYLKIQTSSRWGKDNTVTAKQLANDWKKVNKELKDAKRYHVTIFNREAPSGIAVKANTLNNEESIQAFVDAIKNIQPMAEVQHTLKGEVVTGLFDE